MANEMMANLIQFNTDLEKFAEQENVDLSPIIARISREIFAKTIQGLDEVAQDSALQARIFNEASRMYLGNKKKHRG